MGVERSDMAIIAQTQTVKVRTVTELRRDRERERERAKTERIRESVDKAQVTTLVNYLPSNIIFDFRPILRPNLRPIIH